MKKIILTLTFLLLLFSCKEDKIKTPNCSCVDKVEKIKAIGFGFKDSITFSFKENKVRKLKIKETVRLPYDLAVNKDSLKEHWSNPKFIEYSLCINEDNFFDLEEFKSNDNTTIVNCYQSNKSYVKSSIGFKDDGEVFLEKYILNLINLDIYLSKVDVKDYPLLVDTYKEELLKSEMVLGQMEREIGRIIPIKLYDINTFEVVKEVPEITFNYLRDIKIISRGGQQKHLAKILFYEEEYNEEAEEFTKKEFYIDLKEIQVRSEFLE